MYLKSLHIINFQKHSELNLNFVNGVNVIQGESGVGKSCIKHAIEFLCLHDTFNGQRKVGTKTTSVKGEFSNGVIVERIISKSINRYILTKDGKELIFDSVGKTAPNEIKEAIGIYPLEVDGEELYLNSQSQCTLPFLFDKTPSFRMKLFNKLTGNDVLDKLFGQFNKDILRIKRGYKEEEKIFEERAKILNEKGVEKEKTEAIHSRVKIRIENIKNLYERYSKLLTLEGLEEANTCDLQEVKFQLKNLKFPEPNAVQQLKEKIEHFNTLIDVKNRYEKLQVELDRVSTQLKGLNVPTIKYNELNGKIQTLDTLKDIKEKLDTIDKSCYTFKKDIKILDKELSIALTNQKQLIKEMNICFFCKRPITDECLKEMGL